MAANTRSVSESEKRRFSQPRACRDILLVGSPILLSGLVGNLIGLSTLTGGAIINLGYVLMIVLGGIILKQQRSSWREIGLRMPRSTWKTILLGSVSFVGALVVFVAAQMVGMIVFAGLGLTRSGIDQSRFNPVEGNSLLFVLMIGLSWSTIAFGEEMFYRSFLITRMTKASIKPSFSILIAGTIFGAVHFAEGPIGMLSNGAFGVLFGWIYLRSGLNLWITIIGHGLINSFRFTLLFLGAA